MNKIIVIALVIIGGISLTPIDRTFAQVPDKVQIEKDLTRDNTISIEFTADDKGRILKFIEDGFEHVEYTVGGIRIKVKAKVGGYDKPVTAVIYGDAVYKVIGSTYTYKQFRVASNEYEGIPGAPSSDDILRMINEELENIFSSENQNIVLSMPEISLANDPGFSWGAITKFTCKFTARFWYKDYLPYDEKGDYIAYVEMPFEFRIFRDDMNSAWRDASASARRQDLKIIERRYMPQAEISELKTLWQLFNEN